MPHDRAIRTGAGIRLALALGLVCRPVAAEISFAARTDVNAGSGATAMAVCLADADSLPDLLLAGEQGVLVRRGTPSGGLAEPTRSRSFARVRSLRCEDVDADGQLDLLYVNEIDPVVFVQHGDGRGGFGAARRIGVGARALGVWSADLNLDRRRDLVVNTRAGIAVLYGRAGGTFAAPHPLAESRTAGDVVVADFDGDGRPDIAELDSEESSVKVYLGNAAGFGPPRASRAGLQPTRMAAMNSDHDAYTDLVVADGEGILLLVGAGDGSFAARRAVGVEPARALAVSDVNHDSHDDVVLVDANRWVAAVLFGDGNGGFARGPSLATASVPIDVAVGDLGADGSTDLFVLSTQANAVTLIRRNDHGRFDGVPILDGGRTPVAAAAADVNADRHRDLIVADGREGAIRVLLGNGRGRFAPGVRVKVGGEPSALVADDFDGDGQTDVAVADSAGSRVAVLGANGPGNFAAPFFLPVGLGPVAIASADMDGDGNADLLTANQQSESLSLWFGTGHGGFARPTNFPVVPHPAFLMVGDMNGDRHPEVIVGSDRSQKVSVLKGSARGPTGPSTEDRGGKVRPLVADDFDGDGNVDLVVPDPGTARLKILPGRGGDRFGEPVYVGVGHDPTTVLAGDFNGDRRPDLVVLHRNSGTTMLLLNDGPRPAGSPVAPATRPAGPTPTPRASTRDWSHENAVPDEAWR